MNEEEQFVPSELDALYKIAYELKTIGRILFAMHEWTQDHE